jgi:hypothetical protein
MKSKVAVLFGVLIAVLAVAAEEGCGGVEFRSGDDTDAGVDDGGEGGAPDPGPGGASVGKGGTSGFGSGGTSAGKGGAPDAGPGGASAGEGGVPDTGLGGEGGSPPDPQQVFLDTFPGLVCKAMQCVENGNDSATASTILQCLTRRWNGGYWEDLSSVCYQFGTGTGVTCEDWVRKYFARVDPSKVYTTPPLWKQDPKTAEQVVNDCP